MFRSLKLEDRKADLEALDTVGFLKAFSVSKLDLLGLDIMC